MSFFSLTKFLDETMNVLATTTATFLIVVFPMVVAFIVVGRALYSQLENTQPLHLCTILLVNTHPLKATVFTIVTEIVPLLTYLWVDRKTRQIYDDFKTNKVHQTIQNRTALKVSLLTINQR